MNATGVAHRRGFAIILLLAAVALAAWLIQGRLVSTNKPTKPAAAAEAAAPAAAPAEAPAAPPAAPPGDGYGAPADGAAAPAAPGAAAPAAPAAAGVKTTKLVGKSVARMGEVVADQEGWTAYRFDKDTKGSGKSTCNGTCAATWPPMLVDDLAQVETTGIDRGLLSLITRDDGTKQVAINGWGLYRFAADGAPGKWKGQAVGGVWYVIKPNGARNVSCLPPGAKPPAN